MTLQTTRQLLAIAAILALPALTPLCHAQIAHRDAGQLRFESGFGGPPPGTWPADAPAIRFYFTAGASAPSCGLLVAAKKWVVPLLEPDEGADFPQCTAVPSALVLQRGTERFYLLRVRQKDTREDSSLTDMLFVDRGGVPVPLDDLSSPSAPTGKPLNQVAAWLSAHWINQTSAQQGARALPEHTAITTDAYLAVAQFTDGRCQFTLGSPVNSAPSLSLTKSCSSVKATSAFHQGATSWFVVLFDAEGQSAQALVFEASAKATREAPELAAPLGTKAAEGKILPLRQALQKLVAARR